MSRYDSGKTDNYVSVRVTETSCFTKNYKLFFLIKSLCLSETSCFTKNSFFFLLSLGACHRDFLFYKEFEVFFKSLCVSQRSVILQKILSFFSSY